MDVLFRMIHRIIGHRRENGPDRNRNHDHNCLEISVMSGRAVPLVSGIFLMRVSIYRGGSVSIGARGKSGPIESGGRKSDVWK